MSTCVDPDSKSVISTEMTTINCASLKTETIKKEAIVLGYKVNSVLKSE